MNITSQNVPTHHQPAHGSSFFATQQPHSTLEPQRHQVPHQLQNIQLQVMQQQVINKSNMSGGLTDHDSTIGSHLAYPPNSMSTFRTGLDGPQDYMLSNPYMAPYIPKPNPTTYKPTSQTSLSYDTQMYKSIKPPMSSPTSYTVDPKTGSLSNLQNVQMDKQSSAAPLLPTPTGIKYPTMTQASSRMATANKLYQPLGVVMPDHKQDANVMGVLHQNQVQGILSRPYSATDNVMVSMPVSASTTYLSKNQSQGFTPWNAPVPKPTLTNIIPAPRLDLMSMNKHVRMNNPPQPRLPMPTTFQQRINMQPMTIIPNAPPQFVPQQQQAQKPPFNRPYAQSPSSSADMTNWKPPTAPSVTRNPPPNLSKPPPVPSLVMGVPKALQTSGKKAPFLAAEEVKANQAKDRESLLSSISSFFPANKTSKSESQYPPTTRTFSSRPGRKKNYVSPTAPTPFPVGSNSSDQSKRTGPIGGTQSSILGPPPTTQPIISSNPGLTLDTKSLTRAATSPTVTLTNAPSKTPPLSTVTSARDSTSVTVVTAKITKKMTLAETRPKKGEVKKIELDE